MNSMGGVRWGGVCHVRVKWGPPFGRHAALWLFHSFWHLCIFFLYTLWFLYILELCVMSYTQ